MSLLGLDLGPEFAKNVFTLEGCDVDDSDPDNWVVSSPSHRLDLEREVDLYEEVGRVYGLDRIPTVLPRVAKSLDGTVSVETGYGFIKKIKQWGAGVGLNEAINYSFVGDDDLDRLNLPAEGRVHIANPLSEDQNVMRTDIAPGLLNTLKNNLAQSNNHVRIFEVAKKFVADSESETETSEHNRLGILLYGSRHAAEWPWGVEDVDYLDIKGHVENLIEDQLKLSEPEFVLVEDHAYLEPCVEVKIGTAVVGIMGKIKTDIADFYHAKKDAWLADLDLATLREMVTAHKIKFVELPKFPSSRRDVTVIGPTTLQAQAIRQAIGDIGIKILESVELVAEFIPEGQEEERNLSFRLTYRSPTKTLKDKQVDKEHKKVLEALTKVLPVRI
jgi:phenylalanyl-tRNA synthetase beta chain